jgi:outer membrane protein OmpA-like peptidoglycan-associated protein
MNLVLFSPQVIAIKEVMKRFSEETKMNKRLGFKGLTSVGLLALMLAAGQGVAQEQNAAEPAPVEQQVEQQAETPAAPAAVPEEITALLADTTPLAEVDDKALRGRARRAQKALDGAELPQDVRDQLVSLVSAIQTELKARKEAAQAQPEPAPAPAEKPVEQAAEPAPEPPKQEVVVEPAPAPEPVPEPAPVQEAAPEPAPVPEPEPVQQAAPEPAPEPAPVQEQPQETLKEVIVEAPAEAPKAAEAAPAPPPAPQVDKQEAKELDGNAADPQAEAAAKAFLNDTTPADQLSDDDLRKRLDGMRDVMASNELSRETERSLRKKLKTERDVLRQRLALAEAAAAQKAAADAAQQQAAQPAQKQASQEQTEQAAPVRKRDKKFNLDVQINIGTPAPVVLRDRRNSDDLEEVELRRRIDVFRDAQRDRRFELSDREFYGETVRRDREVLRRRMLDDRQRRRVILTDEPTEDIDIELNDAEVVVPARRKRDVFAAEVDDAELEEVLIAPPTRKIRRKLTVDQATFEPAIRNSVPRIEVDTVRFGFNEAFVREEEVGNLDRVAEVIEKILRKYPREVFLIEGHTDAVGSDTYNQKLSKARAEAIKKALTIYYVIPAKNLKTVGLGERYLKIPTAEAEAENRRVSISRATALVGEVD